MKNIAPEVAAILSGATIADNVVRLPGAQLPRPTYEAIDAVLKGLGGKWSKKLGGHAFPSDPTDKLTEALDTGCFVNRQQELGFFETPPEIADRMAAFLDMQPGQRVLEPSCGTGNLIVALPTFVKVWAVEVDPEIAARCADRTGKTHGHTPIVGDFLDLALSSPGVDIDAVTMNPPFAKSRDIAHVRAAFNLLRAGGRFAAIVSEGPFFRQDREATSFREWLESPAVEIVEIEKLPHGTFRDVGTQVAARLILAIKR